VIVELLRLAELAALEEDSGAVERHQPRVGRAFSRRGVNRVGLRGFPVAEEVVRAAHEFFRQMRADETGTAGDKVRRHGYRGNPFFGMPGSSFSAFW
jgi:hypothetical protein